MALRPGFAAGLPLSADVSLIKFYQNGVTDVNPLKYDGMWGFVGDARLGINSQANYTKGLPQT